MRDASYSSVTVHSLSKMLLEVVVFKSTYAQHGMVSAGSICVASVAAALSAAYPAGHNRWTVSCLNTVPYVADQVHLTQLDRP